ncbi:MAG TPA: hypothetical protein VGA78_13110 [Gemmatimonadales bacterium]|jgi:hypothetical protein
MARPDPTAEARKVRLLHAILVGGVILLGATLFLVVRLRGGPLLAGAGPADPIAYVMSAAALSSLGLAVMVFRPRLPEPARGDVSIAYWTPENRGVALLLWVLFEGAGSIGAVGYLLTGHPAPLLAAAMGLLALLWYSPGRLAGD